MTVFLDAFNLLLFMALIIIAVVLIIFGILFSSIKDSFPPGFPELPGNIRVVGQGVGSTLIIFGITILIAAFSWQQCLAR